MFSRFRRKNDLRLTTKTKHRSQRFAGRFTTARIRPARADRGRPWRVILTAVLALGSAAALAWVVYLLAFSPTLRLQNVEILFPQKEHTVTEAQVEDALVPLMGTHLLSLDPSVVRQRLLSALPRLKDAVVKPLPPGTLRVEVWESARFGIVRQPLTGLSYVVNDMGRVTARAGDERDTDQRFVVLTTEPYALDQQVFAPSHLAWLTAFMTDIRTTLQFDVERTTYDPLAREAKVKIRRGPELWVDFTKDERETLSDLVQSWRSNALKDQSLLYIDLRLSNGRVVYRPG